MSDVDDFSLPHDISKQNNEDFYVAQFNKKLSHGFIQFMDLFANKYSNQYAKIPEWKGKSKIQVQLLSQKL